MKIELGKQYRTRNGILTKKIKESNSPVFPFWVTLENNREFSVTNEGSQFMNFSGLQDLVEEIPAPTLKTSTRILHFFTKDRKTANAVAQCLTDDGAEILSFTTEGTGVVVWCRFKFGIIDEAILCSHVVRAESREALRADIENNTQHDIEDHSRPWVGHEGTPVERLVTSNVYMDQGNI